jgi:hypothetical protein
MDGYVFFPSKCSIFPYKMKIKLWMTTIFLIFWQIHLLGKMVQLILYTIDVKISFCYANILQ